MARPMSLLTRLRHHPPSHSYLTPISTMLIASYFKRKRPREALRVFNWMVRPGSPVVLDERVCVVLVSGFCRNGMVLEALNVLRAMLGANIVPGCGLRKWVYRAGHSRAASRDASKEAVNSSIIFTTGCTAPEYKRFPQGRIPAWLKQDILNLECSESLTESLYYVFPQFHDCSRVSDKLISLEHSNGKPWKFRESYFCLGCVNFTHHSNDSKSRIRARCVQHHCQSRVWSSSYIKTNCFPHPNHETKLSI
ncbi:hypothetical protein ACLB2K_025446 [Fragaria x ananassa]